MTASGQSRSLGDVGSMSGMPESRRGWAIYECGLPLPNFEEGEFTEGHELDRKWKIAKEMIG
jgi:hypothetical protein